MDLACDLQMRGIECDLEVAMFADTAAEIADGCYQSHSDFLTEKLSDRGLPGSDLTQKFYLWSRLYKHAETDMLPVCFRLREPVPIQWMSERLSRCITSIPELSLNAVSSGSGVNLVYKQQDVSVVVVAADPDCQDKMYAHSTIAFRKIDLEEDSLARFVLWTDSEVVTQMMVSVHHCIADLESVQHLLSELLSLDRDKSLGNHRQLPALGSATGDRQGPSVANGRIPQSPNRPRFRQHHSTQGRLDLSKPFSSSFAHGSLDVATSSQIRALARELGVTSGSYMAALWSEFLLRRQLGNNVEIHYPVTSRLNRAGSRFGCHVQMAVLEFSESEPLADKARYCHREVARRLSEGELGNRENLLPKYLFAYDETAVTGIRHFLIQTDGTFLDVGGLGIRPLPILPIHSGSDLNIRIVYDEDRFWFRLHANSEIFRESELQALASEWIDTLQEEVGEGPSRADVPSDCDGELPGCMQAFQQSTESARDAVAVQTCAVTDVEHFVSYGCLDRISQNVAQNLSRRYSPGEKIGVWMAAGVEQLASMLGVWRAGLAYVPLGETVGGALLDRIRLAHLNGLVCGGDGSTEVVRLGLGLPKHSFYDISASWLAEHASVRLHPGLCAYQIQTSGTGGSSKSVVVGHEQIRAFAFEQRKRVGLSARSRILQVLPVQFDASISDATMALFEASTLVIAEKGARMPSRELGQLLSARGVDLATFSAPMLEAMQPGTYPTGIKLITTAEKCSEKVIREWLQAAEVYNGYGPSECVVGASVARINSAGEHLISHGLPGWRLRLADASNGTMFRQDEVLISGANLAWGYLNDARETARHFLPAPEGQRCYVTGDYGYEVRSGEFVFRGRDDHQRKVRGFRIDLGQVEADLDRILGITAACEVVDDELIAFVVEHDQDLVDIARLRGALEAHAIPRFVFVSQIPVTSNGKTDRRGLVAQHRDIGMDDTSAATGDVLNAIKASWREALGHDQFGDESNFFDVGGHSISLVKVQTLLERELGIAVDILDIFERPTVQAQADWIAHSNVSLREERIQARSREPRSDDSVAITGIACRLPEGVSSPEEFWLALMNRSDLSCTLSEDALLEAGVTPSDIQDDGYIKRSYQLKRVFDFDADYFGLTPRQALLMDPQRRMLLECAVQALDNANTTYEQTSERIGVFASVSTSSYASHYKHAFSDGSPQSEYELHIATDKSFAATEIAYRLNLQGPAITIDTACSSSLVAVHTAANALRAGECDVAIVAAASIHFPHQQGYRPIDGHIASMDGVCRPFDERATGTTRGRGALAIVLRLTDVAEVRRDRVYAHVVGSAVSNDGRHKIGFTAPSIEGQEQVIRTAHANAGVRPNQVAFVETHGTGTKLGDEVEIAALRRVHADRSDDPLQLGAVKADIGHLDAAAGLAGLVKAALVAKHGCIPAQAYFKYGASRLDLDNAGISVPITDVELSAKPTFIGVSSFGVGGTNAHVLLQPADTPVREETNSTMHLICLSASSPERLSALATSLKACVDDKSVPLSDLAYTLIHGRSQKECRYSFVAGTFDEVREGIDAWSPNMADRIDTVSFGEIRISEPALLDLAHIHPSLMDSYLSCNEYMGSQLARVDVTDEEKRSLIAQILYERFLQLLGVQITNVVSNSGVSPGALVHAEKLSVEDALTAALSPSTTIETATSKVAHLIASSSAHTPVPSVHYPKDLDGEYGRTLHLAGVCEGDPRASLLQVISLLWNSGWNVDTSVLCQDGRFLALSLDAFIRREYRPETPAIVISEETQHGVVHDRSEALTQAISETLGIDAPDLTQNYIELGGDSLSAIETIEALSRRGWMADPTDLVDAVDIQSAEVVRINEGPEDWRVQEGECEMPSWLQPIYIGSLIDHQGKFNLPFGVKLVADEAFSTLLDRIARVIENADIFHVKTNTHSGKVFLRTEQTDAKLPVVDLSRLKKPEMFARRISTWDASLPIDVSGDMLYRQLLLKQSSNEAVLLFTLHHLIGDGETGRQLLRALTSDIYRFKEFLSSDLQIERDRFDTSFWEDLIGKQSPVVNPAGRADSDDTNVVTNGTSSDLATSRTQVNDFAKLTNTTPFSIYLAAFQSAVQSVLQVDNFPIWFPLDLRAQENLSALGCFVNNLFVMGQSNPDCGELIKDFSDQVRAVRQRRFTDPLMLNRLIRNSDSGLDTRFSLVQRIRTENLEHSPWSVFTRTYRWSKFDFTLFVEESDRGVLVYPERNPEKISSAQEQRIIAEFDRFLGLL